MVHETVLAEQFPALAALMRGEMAESVASESRWMDVDKGTFVRTAQFAYTGDYSIPKGSTAQAVVEAEPLSPPQEPRLLTGWASAWQPSPSAPEPQDEWEFGHTIPSKKGKKSKNGRLASTGLFQNRRQLHPKFSILSSILSSNLDPTFVPATPR